MKVPQRKVRVGIPRRVLPANLKYARTVASWNWPAAGPPVAGASAFALQQVREDLPHFTEVASNGADMAPGARHSTLGFHLRHIAGSLIG